MNVQERCKQCQGSGYMKMDPQPCICEKGCYLCKGSMLRVSPYETCYDCFGDGQVLVQIQRSTTDLTTNLINDDH